ncbi:hypothetical protein HETIRDRAFT_421751 [Heterobasidion irregulare TC 32-1]|uniref:Uncharacterized protein n=1 Tax=Heterobasidion irregulare (strain TC 32-1) TaxID=747525 RepID=W4JXL7_HETIT|nr:uncharacterized protein HETIRDRAFT_421751 [Heterobasidion irregulare TC 32-1]ETW77641.1 hypothetical protein HETIRDRAFT_421751 [Heterobasidion irregulare TC 32-1]
MVTFSALDVTGFAPNLIDMLKASTSLEKVAENDFHIQCVTYAARFDCMVYRRQWVCKRIAAPRPDSRHSVQELNESTVQSVMFVNVSAFIRCVELYSVISIYDAYEFQIHLPRKSRCNSMSEQTLFVPSNVIIQQDINYAGLAFWRHANRQSLSLVTLAQRVHLTTKKQRACTRETPQSLPRSRFQPDGRNWLSRECTRRYAAVPHLITKQ